MFKTLQLFATKIAEATCAFAAKHPAPLSATSLKSAFKPTAKQAAPDTRVFAFCTSSLRHERPRLLTRPPSLPVGVGELLSQDPIIIKIDDDA